MSWDIPNTVSKEKRATLTRIKNKAFNCYRSGERGRYVGFFKAFDRIKNDDTWAPDKTAV